MIEAKNVPVTNCRESSPLDTASNKSLNMPDEYGQLDCAGELYSAFNFKLECGEVLPVATVRELYLLILLLNSFTSD